MKSKSLSRYAKFYAIYMLVFLWSMFLANAQCPTINNTSPVICDASGFNFNNLNSFVADNGNGIAWYSAPTGGIRFSLTQLVSEGTYYVDDNSGACGSRSPLVVDFQVNQSGQNLDAIFCSNENPTIQTYIDQAIQPSIPSGGSVEIYYDFNLTNLANVTDPIPLGGRNYFIVFVDSGNCKSQIERNKAYF